MLDQTGLTSASPANLGELCSKLWFYHCNLRAGGKNSHHSLQLNQSQTLEPEKTLSFFLLKSFCLADSALETSCPFELNSDMATLVLEIQQEGSKAMKDAEPTTLRALLFEMEESEIVDCTVSMHDVTRCSMVSGPFTFH